MKRGRGTREVLYMKQLKTHRAQETSRWREFPVLGANQQYQVLNMLGKGGFSEVHRRRAWEQLRVNMLDWL